MARLYLDEDVNVRLVPLLRARHFEVSTTLEHKMLGIDDAQQLEFALSIQSVLVTHNRVDFENLFREYVQEEKHTAGIVILIRRDVREMAQRLSRFCLTHSDIEDQLFYV